jgi:predicted PurR-regulated permease PerM
MSEKQEKKVVGRTVAIALGIICMVLAVGLVGAVANYTSIISGKDSTIASKDSEINTKNSQIADKDNTISSLNSQISSKDSLIFNLK